MDYLTVTAVFRQLDDETLAGILDPLPILGCQVEDTGGGMTVTVYCDEKYRSSLDAIGKALAAAGGVRIETGSLGDRDWLARYRASSQPFQVGRSWWLDPHPEAPSPAPAGRIRLAIEPRSAFGSGSHESTQLLLLALEEINLEAMRVLDVGTGSGILALAAAAQGAAWIVGFDIDPLSVLVASRTVREQEQPVNVHLFAGPLVAVAATFDLVLCNMLWSQMEPLIPALAAHLSPSGMLLLSGLLAADHVAVASACRGAGLEATGSRSLGEWLALEVRHG